MPHRISREEAVERIRSETAGVACVPCALRDGTLPRRLLHESEHASTMLSGYPRRWGHVMIVLREHHTDYSEIDPAAWADASHQALVAAKIIERVLEPERCYVASLGTAVDGLALTFPHVHLHVIPVYDADERPSEVLTSKDGLLAATDAEWDELHARLRDAWPRPAG